ncbi:MAG: condensation domain-containing protein [Pseudomonadota bacterium]
MSPADSLVPATAPSDHVEGSFPVSAAQERCWFLDQLTPGNPALNVAFRWGVKGEFGAKDFEAAFRLVIDRHEILRTRFVDDGGRPIQQVMGSVEFNLSEIDLRATPRESHGARVDAIAQADAGKPFDLSRPGLLRATLIRTGRNEATLAMTVHQIVFDGWSMKVLGRELGAAAAALSVGQRVELDELPLQYADYALWQREYFQSAVYSEDVAHLAKRLKDAPYFELEPDLPRPAQRTPACHHVTADLTPSFAKRVEAAANACNISPFAFSAAVLSAMLARVTGSSDVLFGTQVAGRIDVDLEAMIGVFINNLVLRIDVDSAKTFDAHAAGAAAVVRDALSRQGVPFNRLVEAVNPVRDPARTPLISINHMFGSEFMERAQYGTFELQSLLSPAPGGIYDLNFQVVNHAGGSRFVVEYNSDLFTQCTAEALLEGWQSAFEFALEHPDKPVGELPLADGAFSSRHREHDGVAAMEAVLRQHDSVDAAAVVVQADVSGKRWAHGFVTASASVSMPLEALPVRLLEDLRGKNEPDFVPDGISILRAMPRDGSGQVARAKLVVPRVPAALAKTYASDGLDATHIEHRLIAIWQDVLGVTDVRPTSNFFDLGGHSLLTVRLLAKIDAEFGHKPDLATLYRRPTVRDLAEEIARARPSSPQPEAGSDDDEWRLVELSPAGANATAIGVNNVSILHGLLGTPAADRHIFTVRFYEPGHDHGLAGLDFPQMAAKYIAVMRQKEPHGPYILFGECVHGVLAVEMARQLREAGEDILLLATVNMWHPSYGASMGWLQRWQVRLRAVRDNFKSVRSGQKTVIQFLGNYSIPHKLNFFHILKALGVIRAIPPRTGSVEQEDFLLTLMGARNAYHPDVTDLPILQMLTPDSPMGPGYDPSLGWTRVAVGPLDVVHVRPHGTTSTEHPQLPSIEETLEHKLTQLDRSRHSKAAVAP